MDVMNAPSSAGGSEYDVYPMLPGGDVSDTKVGGTVWVM